MKKTAILLMKVIISIGLLSYLFFKIDWSSFLDNMGDINLFYIVISALMAYLGIYVSILKWGIFLRNYDIVINKFKLYSVYSIGAFFNNFLPTSIGGDIYRVINIDKRIENRKKEIISSVLLERGFGFLSLFIINILVAPFFYKIIVQNRSFFFIEALILFAFLGITLCIYYYPFLIKIKNKITKKKCLL
jgi:hypothetical protein